MVLKVNAVICTLCNKLKRDGKRNRSIYRQLKTGMQQMMNKVKPLVNFHNKSAPKKQKRNCS